VARRTRSGSVRVHRIEIDKNGPSGPISEPEGSSRPSVKGYLAAEEVAQLYSLRWEIELTFKELKSHYALDKFRTTKAIVVEALIWSALLTLVASRQIHNLVRRIQPPELRPRYPALKWARVFRATARDILRALLGYLGLGKGGSELYRGINTSLTRMALDSHVKRHRLREDWSRVASLS
jgi:putative transposase